MGFKRLEKLLSSIAIYKGLVRPKVLFGAVFIPVAIGLSGCSGGLSMFSSSEKKPSEIAEEPPAKLFAEADALLAKGKHEDAAKKFENVDRIHPYSQYARRSIAMSAYAYYKNGNHDKAIAAASRYIKLHPGTKETAMAYNIIASAYFDQVRGPKNDQATSKKALGALKTLISRYPNSRYAEKSRNRIRIVNDVIAASEMNVGRYYLKRSNYNAAINRFKVVVKDFQRTQQVEEALMRLSEAYLALGIAKEAQTAAAVLGHNFPSSKWYRLSYNLLQKNGLTPKVDQGSWMARAWSTTVRDARS